MKVVDGMSSVSGGRERRGGREYRECWKKRVRAMIEEGSERYDDRRE